MKRRKVIAGELRELPKVGRKRTRQRLKRASSKAERQLARRVTELQRLCGAAYQMAGIVGAPVRFLDNLSAASAGRRLPHRVDGLLPVYDYEFEFTLE